MVIRHGRQYTTSPTHLVEVLCACDDIEHCDMERYVSDVRKAHAEIAFLRQRLVEQDELYADVPRD